MGVMPWTTPTLHALKSIARAILSEICTCTDLKMVRSYHLVKSDTSDFGSILHFQSFPEPVIIHTRKLNNVIV